MIRTTRPHDPVPGPPQQALRPDPEAAGAYFPRGLFQPTGSFRFSLDALLLAPFAGFAPDEDTAADLGAGCGAAGFAALLRKPDLRLLALEREAELCEAAQRNAQRLGWAGRVRVLRADCADPLPEDLRGSRAVVLANPPYREPGRGRLPKSALRRRALFEEPGTLAAFCRATTFLLRPNGRAVFIHPAGRLPVLIAAFEAAGLAPCRLRPVLPREHAPPSLVLVEARRPDKTKPPALPVQENPLVLHTVFEGRSVFTPQALDFCPELARDRAEPKPGARPPA